MSRITPISKVTGRKAVAAASGKAGGDWLKIEGSVDYDIRILPPLDGETYPWITYTSHDKTLNGHFDMFTVDGKRRKITCPVEQFGEPECPICKVAQYLSDEGSSESGLSPKTVYFMNVVVDDQLMLWSAPPSVQAELAKLWNNAKYGPKMFYPDTGRNVSVSRNKEASGFWKYSVVPDPERSAISVPDWEEKAATLHKLVHKFSYEEIMSLVEDQLADYVPLGDIFGSFYGDPSKTQKKKKTAKKVVTKKTTSKKIVAKKRITKKK